ncbi:MAG: VCBS repeat-containing protein [Verrucomicrobia bacterium]|nr:VCBS repeat-containing protein [Verrucomicrobiota bacterium]
MNMKLHTLWLLCSIAIFSFQSALGAAFSANFNGEDPDSKNRDELAVYDPDTGNWFILTLSEQLLAFAENWGWNQANPAPGDYNGDGKSELAVYERASGAWFIKTLGDNQALAFAEIWGDSSMISVPADYNGDGKTDLGLYQPSTGNWFIKTLNNQLLAFGENWGGPDMTPVPADYDGDGKAELAVYQRHTGNWFIKTLGDNRLLAFGLNWGTKGMWPVVGDYTGDGKADLAVYDRANGNWFIKTLNGGQLVLFAENWGWNETTPVPGDYNGDGKADLAVYHRLTANWFIRTVDAQALAFSKNWGIPGKSVPTQVYAHRGAEGRTLVCFGDSITYGTSSSSGGPPTGYPALLERKLDIYFGGQFSCLNYGNPGEYTWDAVNRVAGVLNANPNGDAMLLMEGTNDALFDSLFTLTEGNLRSLLFAAQSRGMKTVIATIPPVITSAYRNRDIQAGRIRSFNPTIYTIASSTGSRLARVYESITAVPGWAASLIDPVTANHPNDAGYLRVRDAFFDQVQGMVLYGQ